MIIQSGCHGSFVGRLDLTLEGGKLAGVEHALIRTDETIAEDPDMAALVAEAVAPHRDLLSHVVGRLDAPIDRSLALETSMDNVLLEAIAAAAGTQLAFSNGWRYGAPVLPGAVTLEHLWNIVPTNAPVSTVELLGDELRELLEANLERTFSADPYKQMGGFVKRCRGLSMYFKVENPAGQRIQDLIVEGEPLVGGRIYRAAMLGEQGVPGKYGSHRRKLDIHAVDALQRRFARGTVDTRLCASVVAV